MRKLVNMLGAAAALSVLPASAMAAVGDSAPQGQPAAAHRVDAAQNARVGARVGTQSDAFAGAAIPLAVLAAAAAAFGAIRAARGSPDRPVSP